MLMSSGQRLLWLLQRYRGDGGALNCPVLLQVDGWLDHDVLAAALTNVVRRHESLRTVVNGDGRPPGMRIKPPHLVHPDIVRVDGASLTDLVLAELRTPIDPRLEMFRTTVFQRGTFDHVISLNVHHLATDAWSNAVISSELGQAYGQLRTGPARLSKPTWQYRDVVLDADRQLQGAALVNHVDYWTGQLSGAKLTDLSNPGSERTPTTGRFEVRRLSSGEHAGLLRLCRQQHCTPFAAVLACFLAAVYRLTGTADLAVFTLFANRVRPETHNTVGYLCTLLVLRARLRAGRGLQAVIAESQRVTQEAFLHQQMPFHLLPPGTIQGPTTPKVIFQMLGRSVHQFSSAELRVRPYPMPDGWGTRFDLDIVAMETDHGLQILANFAEDRVPRDRVINILDGTVSFIRRAIQDLGSAF